MFTPGSFAWLLGHEMRLAWRAAQARAGSPRRAFVIWSILALGLAALGLFVGLPLAFVVKRTGLLVDPAVLLGISAGVAVIGTLMLSQTLSMATVLFFQRGDLDLLLSSPLPAWKVLAVRTLALSGAMLPFSLVLFAPVLIPLAAVAGPGWLGGYVVLGCIAVLAAMIGVWLALLLFAVMGPRRTRTFAQVLAAFIGATLVIITQSYNLAGRGRTQGLWRDIQAFARSEHFSIQTPLLWPARAVQGEPAPLAALVLVTIALYAVSVALLGRRFAANAAAVAGAPDAHLAVHGRDTAQFRGGPFVSYVRKEWKLLARDPALLSQILLQMLYLAPLAFLLIQNASRNLVLATATGAGGLVFLAGQLAGSLGWLTISGEEAPDLLACAPVTPNRARQAKVAAVMIPAYALLALPLLGLAVFAPWPAVVAFFGCTAAAIATICIELWRQKPGKRTEFRRARGGAVLTPLLETFVGLCFAAATGLAVARLAWALLPLLVGVAVTWAIRPSSAKFRAV